MFRKNAPVLLVSVTILLGLSPHACGQSPFGRSPYRTAKPDKEILFERMAPWVFVEYGQSKQGQAARFFNTNSKAKSGWLSVGDTLNGATIVQIRRDSALVRLGSATQKLLYVSETPPPMKNAALRTPAEVAEAQRRYKEFYMKKFIVSGKEYARRAGRKSNAIVPPKEERREAPPPRENLFVAAGKKLFFGYPD